MGKGDKRRPTLISRKEEDLRWALFLGHIDRKTFDQKLKTIRGSKSTPETS